RRHTRFSRDWSSDVCSSDLEELVPIVGPQVMATNSLVLVVEEGNPAQIGGVEDLARDDLVVVLGAPEVPVGRYASELLEEAGVRSEERRVGREGSCGGAAGR